MKRLRSNAVQLATITLRHACGGALAALALSAAICVPTASGAPNGESAAVEKAKPSADRTSSEKERAVKERTAKGPGKSAGSANPKSERHKGPAPALTPDREATAMAFVREHHPEVAELLERLKANRPVQYRRAALQLLRSSERISQLKDRDPQRYELELKLWKTTSRIQLLMARATMRGGESVGSELDAELKNILTEQQDTRIALRKLERDRAAKRLAEVEKDVARAIAERDGAIEKQLASLHENLQHSRRKLHGKGTHPDKPKTAAPAGKPAAD